ncbi:MAG TPA: NAD(P)H-dependent oxidoreductase [Verrucomicrobiae bacterium]|jgi:nitroreductase
METKELLKALEWRYATKRFDNAKKISGDTWDALEKALVLTPTSYGLQPYQFIVLTDAKKRAELQPHSWNQPQVTDCSHYVVFTARTKMDEAYIDRWIKRLSEVRGVTPDSLGAYRGMMVRNIMQGGRGMLDHEWAIRQTYIALGNLMTCAAMLGVDACPMEGIVPAEYDRILNLGDSGYTTVVACAVGYRAADDKNAKIPKARFHASDLIQKI